MNDLYFACSRCKDYIEVGYRWAYWELEHAGVVVRGAPVDIQSVRAAEGYWRGESEADWLAQLLPKVRSFLDEHEHHEVEYGDDDDVLPDVEEPEYFEWLLVAGYTGPDLSPRYFVDCLRFTDWRQVEDWTRGNRPWWWDDQVLCRNAKQTFERLAARR